MPRILLPGCLFPEEPEDVAASVADMIRRFPVGPVEVEKRRRARVHQRLPGPETVVSADGADQFFPVIVTS